MTPPLAHAGHWLADLIYAAPVLVMLAVGVFLMLRDRLRERRERNS